MCKQVPAAISFATFGAIIFGEFKLAATHQFSVAPAAALGCHSPDQQIGQFSCTSNLNPLFVSGANISITLNVDYLLQRMINFHEFLTVFHHLINVLIGHRNFVYQ